MGEEFDLKSLFEQYEKTSAVTILPEGKHRLEVTGATVRNNGIMPSYKILEGPDSGKRALAGGIYPGSTEGGRIAFFRKLEKFGLGKEFFAQRPSLNDIAKALVGRVVIVELGVEDYLGEPRNSLSFNIELVSAPPVPAIGGSSAVPQVAATGSAQTSTPPTPTEVAAAPVAAVPDVAPVAATPVVDEDPGF